MVVEPCRRQMFAANHGRRMIQPLSPCICQKNADLHLGNEGLPKILTNLKIGCEIISVWLSAKSFFSNYRNPSFSAPSPDLLDLVLPYETARKVEQILIGVVFESTAYESAYDRLPEQIRYDVS